MVSNRELVLSNNMSDPFDDENFELNLTFRNIDEGEWENSNSVFDEDNLENNKEAIIEANQLINETFVEFGLINKDSLDISNLINEPTLPLSRRLSKAEEELKSRSGTEKEVLHFRERLKSKIDSSGNKGIIKKYLDPRKPLTSLDLSVIEEKSGESGDNSIGDLADHSVIDDKMGNPEDPKKDKGNYFIRKGMKRKLEYEEQPYQEVELFGKMERLILLWNHYIKEPYYGGMPIDYPLRDEIINFMKKNKKLIYLREIGFIKKSEFYRPYTKKAIPNQGVILKTISENNIKNLGIKRDFYLEDMPKEKLEIIYPSWKLKFLDSVKIIITVYPYDCKIGTDKGIKKLCDVCGALTYGKTHKKRKVYFRKIPKYPTSTFRIRCECFYCHKKKIDLGLKTNKFYWQFFKKKVFHPEPEDIPLETKFKMCFEARRWNQVQDVRKYRRMEYGCWGPERRFYYGEENGRLDLTWREDFLASQLDLDESNFCVTLYDEEV